MIKKLLEGRPFGHPLHPLIVHLPLGLWLMSLVFDAVALFGYGSTEPWPVKASFLCIVAGSAVALLAIVTGFNDWLDIREDHPAQTAALWHMGANMAATACFIGGAAVRWGQINHLYPSWLAVGLSLVGYGLVTAGGYLGGLLVFDDGVAVGRHRRRGELPQETLKEALPNTTEVALPRSADLAEDFLPVAPVDEVAHCHTLRVELRGYVICVAKCGDAVHAFQEFCTHRCGPLSEGRIDGDRVECPWHKSVFDMKTGEVVSGPAKVPLKTFETQVRDGVIHVRVPRDRERATPGAGGSDDPSRPAERRNPIEDAAHTRVGNAASPAKSPERP